MHDQIDSSPIHQWHFRSHIHRQREGLNQRVDDGRVEWGKEMRNQSVKKKGIEYCKYHFDDMKWNVKCEESTIFITYC